jgi:hypothetical protein
MNQEQSTSILFQQPAAIATLANKHAIDDLRIFFASFQLWNTELPPMYLYCCSEVLEYLDKTNPYKGPLFCKVMLDSYKGMNRQQMEHAPSQSGLSNLFHDFTQEKCDLIDWALKSLPEDVRKKGVLFCDADICWLGPLPSIPSGKVIGLSPHKIHEMDETLYGTYNAGFVWMNTLSYPSLWKQACKISRFFEQAALENLEDATKDEEVYIFNDEHNYGWWRMFQSPDGLQTQTNRWTIQPSTTNVNSGLYLDKNPVSSIHTHWNTKDFITMTFNHWIHEKLKSNMTQSKVAALLTSIGLSSSKK